jgi:hypothetical protein
MLSRVQHKNLVKVVLLLNLFVLLLDGGSKCFLV